MVAPIPIALIGTGFAASLHVQALRDVPGLQLMSVAGREIAKAATFAAAAGIGRFTDDALGLVRSKEVAGVILAVPPHIQPSLAVEAFRNGKHVLCEKPMAVTLAAATEVHDAWTKSGCIGMVNFCYRLIPEIADFKSRIQAGECGDLQSLHVEWVLSSRLNRALTYHWKNRRELGGGVLRNFGVHVIDYLFHDHPDVEVRGAIENVYVKTRLDIDGIARPATADEVVTVLFRVHGSASATMHLSVVTTPATGHRIVARGSDGTLEVHNPDPGAPAGPFRLYRLEGGMREQVDVGPPSASTMASMFKRVVDMFAESMHSESQAGPSIADGLRTARLVDAVERAAA